MFVRSDVRSYGISLEKAEKAAANVNVLVTMATPNPNMATAPNGTGVVMIPTMVPTKMPSSLQACKVTPSGLGAIQMAAPTPIHTANFFRSAPH